MTHLNDLKKEKVWMDFSTKVFMTQEVMTVADSRNILEVIGLVGI
jgi:hypothetical protein